MFITFYTTSQNNEAEHQFLFILRKKHVYFVNIWVGSCEISMPLQSSRLLLPISYMIHANIAGGSSNSIFGVDFIV